MALIACQECGKSVSDRALSCPHCGFPLKEDPVLSYTERRVHVAYRVGWIVLGFGAVLTLASILEPDLRALAAGCVVMGALTFAVNLLREYLVRKSKVGPNESVHRHR